MEEIVCRAYIRAHKENSIAQCTHNNAYCDANSTNSSAYEISQA